MTLPGTGDTYLVAAVGTLPGPPKVVRADKYSELLKVLGLRDPVPAEFRAPLLTAWRALAEGVPRIYVAPDVAALALMPEPLVVTGATSLPGPDDPPQAGPRLYLFDPPDPRGVGGVPGGVPGSVPEGMVGIWPWVSMVVPGAPSPVLAPPSALVAGLYAMGASASTYPADPVPGMPPPEGWVRLMPAGKRRLLHLDPAPPRPGSPFPVDDVGDTELTMLWAEAQANVNPVETFTRLLHSRYGAGVRVFLEDAAVRVVFPPPAVKRTALVLRMGQR